MSWETMDKAAGKNKLWLTPARRLPMLFRKKWRNPSRNIIAYTIHKAGSMVLHRVLKDICELNRIRYYSPNESRTMLPFDRMFAGHEFIAKKRGCFGPIRFFVPTKAIAEASVILHLRDPRDVLVSMFYSYCYMHAGEIEAHTGYRKEVAEAGIDRFVLDMVGEPFYGYRGDYGIGSRYKRHVGTLRDRYERYLSELLRRRNTISVSYEEMVLSFPSWLERIVAAFDLIDPEETRAVVAARHANSVAAGEEDAWSHKRKVTPGDHREKLQLETIRQLDQIFAPVLDKLGYSAPAYLETGIPVPRR
jgi:Sulfotransferase domain